MKKFISILTATLLLATAFSLFLTVGVAAATEISFASPAITADIGEKIDLSDYSVIFEDGGNAVSDIEWKQDGKAITEFTPDKKGVTALTAVNGDKTKTVYVVAKEKDEKEYVLYETDFASFDSIDDLKAEGWHMMTANAKLEDGNFVLGSNGDGYARVILPEWLGDFGDYSITANIKMLSTADSARWFGLVYRIQNANKRYFPYYHMCVRENTTTANGIEFAERTTSDAWNVALTGSGDVGSVKSGFNTVNVIAKGTNIQQNLNGEEIVYVTNSIIGTKTVKYNTGMIGLTMNYGTVAIKDIKVTVQETNPVRPEKKLNLINNAHQENNLINAIANVQAVEGNKAEEIISGDNAPGIAYVKISELGDVKSFIEKCVEAKVIPTLYAANTEEADKAINSMGAIGCKDLTLISSDAEVLSHARNKNSLIRTGLTVDLTKPELTSKEAAEIRKAVRSAPATFCVIKSDNATKQAVAELQELAVAVWVEVASSVDSEEFITEALKAVTSGANGIISADAAKLTAVINEYLEEGSMTRTPVMIGHRGNPSQAPENSLSGFITAYENGADVFEIDVEITKDGHVIIMHDGTITRTTNYTGSATVGQMTLEEVKQYFLLAKNGSVSDEKVPTLREVLEEFKDKDCRIFVEFKGSNAANVNATAQIIKEFDMEDRVDVISFNANFLKQTQTALPGMSTGYLLSPQGASGTYEDALESLYSPLVSAQGANSTINPSSGVVTNLFIQAATDRGMTVWPWTYVATSNNGAFMICPDGITTDDVQWAKNMVKVLEASASEATLTVGQTSEIKVNAVAYGGKSTEIDGNKLIVKAVNGGDLIEINEGVITAKEAGKATVIYGYEAKTLNGSKYVVYTQPVTLDIVEPIAESQPDEDRNGNNNILIIIIVAAAVVIAAVVAVLVIKKKK